MKKIFVTLVVFIACQGIFAQNIDDLFNHFKEKKGAEYVNIPPIVLKLGRLFMDKDGTDYRFIKGVNSVQVLDMEDCSSAIRKDFQHEVNQLDLHGYETLVQTKEKDETVKLITKMDNDTIHELIVVVTGKDECALTRLKGTIKKEDVEVMMTENKIMIDGRK